MGSARTVVLATRNPGKIHEMGQVLAAAPVELVCVERFPAVPEPPETGATFAQNAHDKALYYARATGKWCLADDSGLEVDALDGAPGVFSARWAADDCPPGATRQVIDAANNARLLEALSRTPGGRRTARFVCHLALANPQGVVVQTFATVEGSITPEPRGENGFGYDPLFRVDDLGCTTAQLATRRKNQISHRGKALRQLTGLLGSLIRGG